MRKERSYGVSDLLSVEVCFMFRKSVEILLLNCAYKWKGADAKVELLFLQVEEKFDELRTFMMDKPYTRHLITPFIAIENDMVEGEDAQVLKDMHL